MLHKPWRHCAIQKKIYIRIKAPSRLGGQFGGYFPWPCSAPLQRLNDSEPGSGNRCEHRTRPRRIQWPNEDAHSFSPLLSPSSSRRKTPFPRPLWILVSSDAEGKSQAVLCLRGILPRKGGFAWFYSRGLNLTLAYTGLLWEQSIWFTVTEPQEGPFE